MYIVVIIVIIYEIRRNISLQTIALLVPDATIHLYMYIFLIFIKFDEGKMWHLVYYIVILIIYSWFVGCPV